MRFQFNDFIGSHWAPHLIHKELWDKIGGFSENLTSGFGSDPDLNMKLWKEGVRILKVFQNLELSFWFINYAKKC